jgi:hypothetical protein
MFDTYKFVQENKELFKKLDAILFENGIRVEQDSHDIIMPRVGSGIYNGVEGFYFNNHDFFDFNESYLKTLFPITIEDKTIELIDVSGVEWDDDRMWKSSMGFVIK